MHSVKKIVVFLSAMMTAFLLLTGGAYADEVKTGVITGSVVNLRENPNTSAKILRQLKKGTTVSVVASEGDWYKISYSDSKGWINNHYITIRDKSISAGLVSGSVVNIRSKPNISSAILTKLTKGTKVEIYERSGDWLRISIGEERYGWINNAYVSIRNNTVSRGQTANVKASVQAPADDKAAAGEVANGDAGEATGEAAAVIDEAQPENAGEKDVEAGNSNTEKVEPENAGEKDKRQEIVEYAKKFLGIKYVYGGSTTKGFDCSGFVCYVYKHFGITLERASRSMGSYGAAVKKADLQPGDLVFFDTNGGLNGINHVGIYIGNDKFIHASSGTGRKVTISSLNDSFYSKSYMRGRDYLTK